MKTETVQNRIIQFFADQFETRTRDNGETFHCLADSRPDWCQDVARECHGGMMPDDYRYNWLSHGADTLADIPADEWEDSIHEIADGMVDIYIYSLLQWCASHLSRIGYVNEETNETSFPTPGNFDLIHSLQIGQFREISETLGFLVSEIESIADDVEPYSAGFNLCGYMPDSESVTFSDFDDAKEYILDELAESEKGGEENENEKTADDFRKAWFWVNSQKEPFSVVVNGLAFWVAENPEWLNNL